ncbi:SET domain-containing protein [Colletotrichum zoysiae]|uniref:SET domain-containing protein n=1 Tax=Colletotrichum zoysiae TaxID=1216348 RepID=A0AAD9HRM8_9PEZI|nr:SET domain-containing protein [Colletotrichum zoysiae]
MPEPLVLATHLNQGGSFPKDKLAPVSIPSDRLVTHLRDASCCSGSHDDLYMGISGPTSKARINPMSIDAMLDVDPESVNSIFELTEPLEEVKKRLREFAVLIGTRLPPIAIRDITWKTVYIAQNIMVGYEADEVEVSETDDDDDDDHTVLSSDVWSSNSGFSSDESGSASLARKCFGRIDSPISMRAADMPLSTTIEGPNGTKERSVIFVNEFFEIRRSPTAGWGAFAVKTLNRGDQILVEKALYHATHENVTSSVQKLPEKQRAIANDMFAHYSRDGETLEEAIWSTNSFVSRLPMKSEAGAVNSLRPGSPDVAGLFPVAGRFNHSCFPKVNFRFRPEHDALVFTVRDWIIEAGDELTISYGKVPSVLYYKYGFCCECGYCRGFDPATSEWY